MSQAAYIINNSSHGFFRKKAAMILVISAIFMSYVYADRPNASAPSVESAVFARRIVPEPIDIQAVRAEDELRERNGGPYRFAVPRRMTVTPDNDGVWEEIDANTLVWRLQINSPGASSISLGFTRYMMPPGGTLLVYSKDQAEVFGPFTDYDNAEHGQLWTPLIHSDDIMVELVIPAGEVANLELTLGSVNHGYRGMLSSDMKALGDSQWCEINAACPQGDGWRDQIRSVAKYHITLADGTYVCTGTLLNNTARDSKNYFLTAFHCFDEYEDGFLANPNAAAASMVVYWNFQTATCEGVTGPTNQTQTGAYFRAAYCPTDFALVELDEIPLPDFNVYYAGWDRNSTGSVGGTAIHHPAGDLKKISVENHALTTSTSLGITACATSDLTHFRVSHWEAGTTEGGSSGCAFFNSSKRVVGQLTGGSATCNTGGYDLFGRFNLSWTGGGTSSTRLSNWLDPLITGVTVLDGNDPPIVQAYCSALGGCDEYISSVVVGTINTISTTCTGYTDNTNLLTVMQVGQSSPIIVTNGYPYPVDQCGMWIDWNQDYDFDDPGETISVNGTPGIGPYTAVITVPSDAAIGETRLRIRITYTGSVDCCGSSDYGEVEDYTIAVVESSGCQQAEYLSMDVPKAIPNLTPVTSTLTVTDNGIIKDLDVRVNISHNYDSDLDVFLIAPDATRIELFTDVGGSGDNFSNTLLDSEALTAITTGSAPFAGIYRPEGNLGSLYGKNMAGTWTLEVTDDTGGITGTLKSWSLIVESSKPGDIERDCDVDFDDLAVLTNQWLQSPGIPSADIAPLPLGDGTVDFLDFAEFAMHWLEGTE